MMPLMEAVPALQPRGEKPPLAAARLRRQLTVESAAKLARLTPDEVTWLEEGRLYRFPSADSASLALLLYATGLGISRREARRLAGLPIVSRPRREQVRLARVQAAREVAARVASHLLRDVRVRPGHLLAGRGAVRIDGGVLAEDEER